MARMPGGGPHRFEIVKDFIKNDLPRERYIGIFNTQRDLIPVREFTNDQDC
jgi:hypothetical protein